MYSSHKLKKIFIKIQVQQLMNFVIFLEAIYSYINSGINIHRMRLITSVLYCQDSMSAYIMDQILIIGLV